jgi:hypothetical protein
MRQTHEPFVGCRDAVTELMKRGEPFDDVEEAIDSIDTLAGDEKDALWLLAFLLREHPERTLADRPVLVAVE